MSRGLGDVYKRQGPVTSDVRITRDAPAESNHANEAGVDCLLAFDLLAAASDGHREGARRDTTIVIGSVDVVPTGEMVAHPGDVLYPEHAVLRRRLDDVSRHELNRYLDAAAITRGLFGATTTANVLVMGAAVQAGALPIDPSAIERAIELNGVAVELNIAAFRFGRHWVVDPAAVEAIAGITAPTIETLDQLIERLASDLADYQNDEYADRFRECVARARAAEQRVDPESARFTEAAARHLHKLMAYKDEYEVARLALLDESQARYRAVGGPDTDVTYHLHPPALRALGVQRKLGFKRAAAPSFEALRSMKRLRGTMADPFRWAEVRKVERAMIPEYEAALDTLIDRLTADRLDEAAAIASLPDSVRGYEDLKLERATAYRAELTRRLSRFAST